MEEVKTLTVGELIKELEKLPKDYKVYTSQDPEGNGYGALSADWMVAGSNEDKVLTIMPIQMLSDDMVMPKLMKRITEELREEGIGGDN